MAAYTEYEANNHVRSTFLNTWNDPDNGWQSIPGITSEPYIHWENTEDGREETVDAENENEEPWLSVYIRHQDSDHDAIGAEGGLSVFDEAALLVIDIYVPVNTGLKSATLLSTVCKRAFKGKRGHGDGHGIIFRSVRSPERGTEKSRWFVKSVLVDFEYDEVI